MAETYSSRRRNRYSFLRTYIVLLKVFAVVGGLIGVLVAGGAALSMGGQNIFALLIPLAWAFYALLGALSGVALAGFLTMCFDVSEDVKKIADNSTKRLAG